MHHKNETNRRLLNDPALIHGIADAAPGMLYVIDLRNMKMVYANQRVLTLFGKSLEELGNMGAQLFDEFVFPEDRPRFDEHIAELLSAAPGEVKELTFRLFDAQRNPTWVRTRRTIYKRDQAGNPTHVISVSQDISREIELQKIKTQLEEEQRRLKEERHLEIFKATLSTQEEERRRMSESLHNGLAQLLFGIKISMNALSPELAVKDRSAYNSSKKYTEKLLTNAISESRRISHELMPVLLDEFGLKAAVADISDQVKAAVNFSCSVILKGV
ncbi:MAG: PAS domain S-box protein, partial [Chitinophagaceae bacterium]